MYAFDTGFRLQSGSQEYEIKSWHEVLPDEAARSFRDVDAAVGFLQGYMNNPVAMATLRKLAATSAWSQTPSLSRYNDRDVIRLVACSVATERLRVIRLDRIHAFRHASGTSVSSAPADAHVEESATEPPPAKSLEPQAPIPASQKATHWIAVQLLDVDTRQPLADVSLRLKLADGSVNTCTTDAEGLVRLDDIQDGPCDLEDVLDDEGLEVVQVA